MKFYLPDFNVFRNINGFTLDLLNSNPEYFYEGVEIGGVYGTFPGAIWNGGRLVNGFMPYQEIEYLIKQYNQSHIPLRYTFTNSLIEEKHLYDTYCNIVMELANNGQNEVIINSPILEEYLREHYPNFKYILSTTRCERNVDKINEATKNYDLVVIDYRDNKNMKFLEAIENKDKIELLVNAYCNPNCPRRKEHYEAIAELQLNYKTVDPNTHSFTSCPVYQRQFYDIIGYPTVITREELYGKYTEMGFQHFKIEGRTMPIHQVIESYLYYMIKPEYIDKVRLMYLSTCISRK